MADVLGDGLAWLEGKRHEHMTRDVVYARGADQVTVAATVCPRNVDVIDDAGLAVQVELCDFLIRTQDLRLCRSEGENDRHVHERHP